MKTNTYLNGYLAGYMSKQAQTGPSRADQTITAEENKAVEDAAAASLTAAQSPQAKQLSALLGGMLVAGPGAVAGAAIAGKGKRLKGAGIGAGIGAFLGGTGGYVGPSAAAGTIQTFLRDFKKRNNSGT